MRKHPFTLIEILIVVLVIAMILGIAAPTLLRGSDAAIVESCLTGIRGAVSEVATRSRSTGRALSLTLDADNHQFKVAISAEKLEMRWEPPSHESEESRNAGAEIISAKDTYDLQEDIAWTFGNDILNDDGMVEWVFFPDGQAAGPAISFEVCGRNFVLEVDRITGEAIITEEN